jgi:hypothetical protein
MVETVLYKCYSKSSKNSNTGISRFEGQKAWICKSGLDQGLWTLVNWVYDSESDHVYFVDILLCTEANVAFITDIYGFSDYFWYPSCEFDLAYVKKFSSFAAMSFTYIYRAISKMFPEIHSVTLYDQIVFYKLVQKMHTSMSRLCNILPLPESVCHTIAEKCLPKWTTYNHSTNKTSIVVTQGRTLKFDVSAIIEICKGMFEVDNMSEIDIKYHKNKQEVVFDRDRMF